MSCPRKRLLAALLLLVFAFGFAGCVECHAGDELDHQSACSDECCWVQCACHVIDVPPAVALWIDHSWHGPVAPDERPALPVFIGSIFQPPRV